MADSTPFILLATAAALAMPGRPDAPVAAEQPTARLRVVTTRGDTGKPLPARIHLRLADGTALVPRDLSGKPMRFAGGDRLWSEGEITVDVPPGKVTVIASHPFEFAPAQGEAEAKAGETTTLALALEPKLDPPAMGWYGGDAHAHIVHGEREYDVDIPFAARLVRAEGNDWLNFSQAYQTRRPEPSYAEALAQCRAASTPDCVVWPGEEYPKDHLGHLAAFAIPDGRAIAEAAGYNNYSGEHDAFTHFEQVRQLEAFGSLAIYTHSTREYGGKPESPANMARGLPMDVLADPERIRVLDVMTDNPDKPAEQALIDFLLNRGLRVGAAAFTDICLDRPGGRPGSKRTYVYLGRQPLTLANLIAALTARHCFGTTGPFVEVKVGDHMMGDVLPADGRRRTLEVAAWAPAVGYDVGAPAGTLAKVQVIRNGTPFREWNLGREKPEHVRLSLDVSDTERCWYAVKVYSSLAGHLARTSPIFFEPEGWHPPAPARAKIEASVVDDATGRPLDARIEVIEYGRDTARVMETHAAAGGRIELEWPAALRLRISAPGHQELLFSPFLDYEPISRGLVYPCRAKDLSDPAYYQKLGTALRGIRTTFRLE